MRALPGFSGRIALPAVCSLAFAPAAPGGGAVEVRELLRDGRFARAAERVEDALAETGSCSEQRVELLTLGAEAWRRGNRKLAPETLARNLEAVELAAELFGADDPRNAEPLLQLGVLRSVRREWADANRSLERSFELLRGSSAGRDPRQSTALAHLAIARLAVGAPSEQVLGTLAEADAVLDRFAPEESPDRAWIHDMRANVFSSFDRPEDSLGEYRASLEIRRRTQRSSHPLLANTLLNVGTMEDQLGMLAKARADYEEVLALLRDGVEIAWTLGDVRLKLGAICQELQDLDGAQAAFELGRAELEQKGQQSSEVYVDVLDRLARLAYARRDFAGARGLADRALHALDSMPGTDPQRRGNLEVLSAWIEIQSEHPDWHRVEEFGSKASAHGATTSPEPLAWSSAARGDLARAQRLLSERAAEIRKAEGQSTASLPGVLRDLARVDFLRGDLAAALAESLDGETLARELWERSALGLEELSALGLESAVAFEGVLQTAVCAASRLGRSEAAERVWDALLLSRDRVYRECEERIGLSRGAVSAEVAVARERLARARETLAALYVRNRRGSSPPVPIAEIERARTSREACERELWSSLRTDRPQDARRVSVRELRDSLDRGAGLVRFCLADRPPRAFTEETGRLFWEPCYFACVLSSETPGPRVLELGSASEIDRLVSDFLGTIRDEAKISEVAAIGARLRRKVLDPVLAALPGGHILFLVPEGQLCRVPFLALVHDDGTFLVERGPLLHVLGCEGDLLRPPAVAGSGILALGDPAFDVEGTSEAPLLADLRASPPSTSAPSLPESRAEVDSIAASWRRGRFAAEEIRALVGEQATEIAFRSAAPGCRVIHLATHGYFEGGVRAIETGNLRGRSPGAAPLSGPRSGFETTALPSLRSGLVFASGTGDAKDDGILTTEEVLAMDLHGVEWVVLSACDTGVGELRRFEGVLGLQRAMRLAGARTVIASLWPVEDRWARAWMEVIYPARFEKGLSTAEAVRAACVERLARLRREGEAPFPRRWASFVAVGDWR